MMKRVAEGRKTRSTVRPATHPEKERATGRRLALMEGDYRPGGAVQQAAQVKADKVIVGVQAEKGGKSRHRHRIFGFELGEGVEIGLRRRRIENLGRQRLKGAQLFLAPAQ